MMTTLDCCLYCSWIPPPPLLCELQLSVLGLQLSVPGGGWLEDPGWKIPCLELLQLDGPCLELHLDVPTLQEDVQLEFQDEEELQDCLVLLWYYRGYKSLGLKL